MKNVASARKQIGKRTAFNLLGPLSNPAGIKNQLIGVFSNEFLDRLLNLALPRVRDFKGVSGKAFDGRGNYTLGIKEHIIFPEIDYSKVQFVKGMNISIVTTCNSDGEAMELLELLGMPFSKN